MTRTAIRKAVSSPPVIANFDEQLDEVVMKIINREEFLQLPENTVFSYAHYRDGMPSSSLEGVFIKGDSLSNDYYEQSIPDVDIESLSDRIESVVAGKSSFEVDLHVVCRNAEFDKGQYYAVWERGDVECLIERLKSCL